MTVIPVPALAIAKLPVVAFDNITLSLPTTPLLTSTAPEIVAIV